MRLKASQRRAILQSVRGAALSNDEQGRFLAWIEHVWTEYQRAPKGAKDTKAARRELHRLRGYTRKLLDALDWQRAWERMRPTDANAPLGRDMLTAIAAHRALLAALGGGSRATADVRRIVRALESLESGLGAAEPDAIEGRPPGKRDLIRRLAALLRDVGVTPTHNQAEPLCVILSVLDTRADAKDISKEIRAALA